MHLVIVESPTKAKTIRKFLGPEYKVLASMGHVRDLPQSASEIPAAIKKESWTQLGVHVDKNFEPLYVVPKSKSKTIAELKVALKEAEDVYLATDEDREGESISWHLLQVLKPKVPIHRMVFHEITDKAIQEALAHPRALDEKLVDAQETRRVLDRLVGYTISPVLWRKIAFGLSAGRVQSVALKAVVDRERARMAFVTAAYADVVAELEKDDIVFEARLVETQKKRVASGKDFDEQTGTVKSKMDVALLTESDAKKIVEEVRQAAWKVGSLQEKQVTRRPPPPFVTSTLQQEANRKLGLPAKRTMQIAQALYEQGYITYMRTDSVSLSDEAVNAARALVASRFGKEYVPSHPRQYSTTSKGAQEAHEAIRPSLTFAPPQDTPLSGNDRDLYELIWMRTLASQMTDSQQLQLQASFPVGEHLFQANGLKILFAGFLRAYAEGEDDPEQAMADKERILPDMNLSDRVTCKDVRPENHETKPPARFTEAALIQFMEKEGIGRPSTYATVISTLQDRLYVRKQGNALIPTFTAFAVTRLMEGHFHDLVDVHFTSKMEEALDAIAEGKQQRLPYLQAFFLGEQGLRQRAEEEIKRRDEEDSREVPLASIPDAKVRIGRYGTYVEAVHPRSRLSTRMTIPEDMTPSDLTPESIRDLMEKSQQGPTTLGLDPVSGENIYLKTGAYGAYLQLGEEDETNKKLKPKRVSVPKTIPLTSLNHEMAAALISLPRLLGMHPETEKEVRAGLGRFGPYVVHDGDYRSLKPGDDVLSVGMERALELLAVPKGTRGGKKLRELGKHSKDKKPVALFEGKFGLYVKHGRSNASVPKNISADDVTLTSALEWLGKKRKT